jgi:predicted PurR-regulated permease PerM
MRQLTPRWIALLVITAITVYVVWLIFAPFLNVVLWSVVLTVIASPLNSRLRYWGRSPNLSALLTLLAVLFVVIIPAALIITATAAHTTDAVKALLDGLIVLTDPKSPHLAWLARYMDVQQFLRSDQVSSQLQHVGEMLARQSFGILGGGILIAAQCLLVLFTTYYLLRDSQKLMVGVRSLLPLTPQQADVMVQNVKTIIAASLKGTVLISAIQGTLGGIAFWFLGLPAALLWGAVMFLTSMIPVVGSSLIWGPAALYLLVYGHWIKALILTLWGLLVIATVDNVLRPSLVGSKTRMHELTVFFSVLGGLQLFGPVGIVAGPIVVAVAQGLLRIFMEDGVTTEPKRVLGETRQDVR